MSLEEALVNDAHEERLRDGKCPYQHEEDGIKYCRIIPISEIEPNMFSDICKHQSRKTYFENNFNEHYRCNFDGEE